MTFGRTISGSVLALLMGVTADGAPGRAADMPVKLVMDWAFEGAQSIWTLAQERGCFAKAGLDVTIDRGFGSGDSASKVAAGAYEVGVSDLNTVIQFSGKNPKKLIAFFVISDAQPSAVISYKSAGIIKPTDLAGKQIGDAPGEAARVLFPAFAKANDLDPAKVGWVNVTPDLRQQILFQKRADAIAGHMFTMLTGLRALGIKDEELSILRFAEWHLNLFGNSLIATPAWLAAHPDAAKGFAGCAAEGIKATMADPKAAIASLKKRNALLQDPVELAALEFSNTLAIVTPNTKANGLSAVSRERLEHVIAQDAEAFEITPPNPDDIYTDKYLPPRAELTLN